MWLQYNYKQYTTPYHEMLYICFKLWAIMNTYMGLAGHCPLSDNSRSLARSLTHPIVNTYIHEYLSIYHH